MKRPEGANQPDPRDLGAFMGEEFKEEERPARLPPPPTSAGHLELRYGPLEVPVPSRWLKVPVVEERVREWQPDNLREIEPNIERSARDLPEDPLWSVLTPQGPILVFADRIWGDRFEPGPVKLHQLMGRDLDERPSWVHVLQISPLRDQRWATNHMAGWLGDVYVMVSQPESC